MLAKKYRLPIQNFVGQRGRTLKSRYFSLKIFPTQNNFSRFGAIISRKVDKRAVIRNRIKRQIFNFFREVKEQLPLADYLIIVFPAVAQLKNEELSSELQKILNLKS